MVQLLEIYHTAQEGCIFFGNMYNDLRAAMGWFVMATNRRYCVYYGTTQLINQPSQFQFTQSELNNIKTMFKKVYFK